MAEPRAFDPLAIIRALEGENVRYILIGGMAATLHGSPHVTFDVDITPERSQANLAALARALQKVDARLRVDTEPDGVPFDPAADLLARMEILNLVTRHGALDISLVPSGTRGYEDLAREAIELELDGIRVSVAALDDVIRSKEAAGREKDRLVLPTLRRLQQLRAEGDDGGR